MGLREWRNRLMIVVNHPKTRIFNFICEFDHLKCSMTSKLVFTEHRFIAFLCLEACLN